MSGQLKKDDSVLKKLLIISEAALTTAIAINPSEFPDFEAAYNKVLAIPLPQGGAFSDLILGDKSYPEGIYAIAEFLNQQSNFMGPRVFGETISLPIKYCDNLLEYSIKVDEKDWTWRNY
jgi:hypothetical protein